MLTVSRQFETRVATERFPVKIAMYPFTAWCKEIVFQCGSGDD